MLSEQMIEQAVRVEDQWQLVGGTPLIQLRRSGDGLVSVKHEGLNPGGSYFDRVAKAQLSSLSADSSGVVLSGTTAHTVSVLTLAAVREIPVKVFVRPDDPTRLLGLIDKLSGNVTRVGCSQEAESELASLRDEGWEHLIRNDQAANIKAIAEIALESMASSEGRFIKHWVVVGYAGGADTIEQGLRRALGYELRVHEVADDFERERALGGNAATRRTQVGHREGLLVGPAGAEVIDRAVSVAWTYGERVCAIVPDGGHRYLGWW